MIHQKYQLLQQEIPDATINSLFTIYYLYTYIQS